MSKTKIAVLAPDKWFLTSFDEVSCKKLMGMGWSGNTIGDTPTADIVCSAIKNADVAITSWDSIPFTTAILDNAPKLGLICHGAGTVKSLVCDEVWERNIRVTSAASAIAIGVGEHSLGLMLSAMKNVYEFNRCMKANLPVIQQRSRIVEIYGITVGVVGCGMTGRRFIELLKPFEVNIVAFDPFMTKEKAAQLGVGKVELDELMSRSHVVALHAPRLPETKHLINRNNLKLLRDDAMIVNTASGWLIDEEALIDELKRRPIIAALDVTFPEPPTADSELRKLPNVILTPHIAGVAANNRFRIGNLVLREIERFVSNQLQLYPVFEKDLAKIA